jgi:hypothetical protein
MIGRLTVSKSIPLPGWHHTSTKKTDDNARWKHRLAEVAGYLAGGNDWPRHNKTDIDEEWGLGVWLYVQRINHRAGKLDKAKETRLNPGWRQGRTKDRRPRSEAQQHTTPEPSPGTECPDPQIPKARIPSEPSNQ